MKLSIVMPVYNEKETIQKIIEKVKQVPLDLEKEIIIVDDGSTDGTRQFLEAMPQDNVKIIYHSKNMGKGAALRTGFAQAGGDVVMTQDSDLEYDPADYAILLDPILRGAADVVYGSRLSGGRPQRVYLFWHKMGNNFLTFITNLLYNTTLTDMETGYKVFRKEVVQRLRLRCKGFSIEPEITAKVFKQKVRVYEVPIAYYGRSYQEGKKITWRHGLSALLTLIWFRFFD
ncbi:MAG: glycosyltransferase family 2 protein [Candidatus Omnitrophica bacterium]|nr:glycosyltransferase family 2 protein [Candidatus Omnitrophota bacterium]